MPHYSYGQKPARLRIWAEKVADRLIEHYRGKGTGPLLVYRGLSGTTMATALALALTQKAPLLEFGMVYVRKPEERSHGASVEWELHATETTLLDPCFIDDFISSGSTYRACMTALHSHEKLATRCNFDGRGFMCTDSAEYDGPTVMAGHHAFHNWQFQQGIAKV